MMISERCEGRFVLYFNLFISISGSALFLARPVFISLVQSLCVSEGVRCSGERPYFSSYPFFFLSISLLGMIVSRYGSL